MMNGQSLGVGHGDAATKTLPALKGAKITINKEAAALWAAVSYFRGPFPRKL